MSQNETIDRTENTDTSEPQVPNLNTLYFYLTEGCNLLCRHCWLAPIQRTPEEPGPVIDPELFYSIVEQGKALGLSGVKLTGGEPLLHPNFLEFVDFIKEQGLSLTVETNGTLCTQEIAEKIASVKRVFVSVSLDGVDAETHEGVRGVEGSFEAALQGIRRLVSVDIHPQIIMSIMRNNRGQMESLVRFAEELGAESVKFNVVQPIARGEKLHEQGETLSSKELVETGEWVEQELAPSSKIRVIYHHPHVFVPLHKIYSEKQPVGRCGILGILGVLGDGSYALCGIGQTVDEMVFGHASQVKLEDVWKNTPVLEEIRKGLPERFEGICKDCLMKYQCLGTCVAQNYHESRDLWAPFWYCREAKKAGLFPESRLKKGC